MTAPCRPCSLKQLFLWLALGASLTLMGCGSEDEDRLDAGGDRTDQTVQVSCATLGDGNPDESLCCEANSRYMAWNPTINMWLSCCSWDHDSNQCSNSVGEACVDYDAAKFASTSTVDYSKDCTSDNLVCQKQKADDECWAAWSPSQGLSSSDPATYCSELQKYGQCLKDAQCCVSGTEGENYISKFNSGFFANPCAGTYAITNPCSNMSTCVADTADNCASAYGTAVSGSTDAATICPEFEKYSQCLKDAGCCGETTLSSYSSALDTLFTGTAGLLCTGSNAVTNPCNPGLRPPCSPEVCATAYATAFQNIDPTDVAAAAAAICPEAEKYSKCLKDRGCCDDSSVASEAAKQALQSVFDTVGGQYCTGSNSITNQCT